jgi:hypothetical protein
MITKLIFLKDINFKASPVVRAAIPNPEVVNQYAESYQNKRLMPAIVVFYDPELKVFYLADGRHRCEAAIQIGRKAIMADIHEGNFDEALKFALLANAAHGLPRSNRDKRRCVESALLAWPQASNAHTSELTATNDKLVDDVRGQMEKAKKIKRFSTRISRAGREVPAHREPEPEPQPEEEKPRVVAGVVAPVVKDKLGRTIPVAMVQFWQRAPEVLDLMEDTKLIINRLKQVAADHDPMYAEINTMGVVAELERAMDGIKTAVPYAVCTLCQGHPETQLKGCRMCYGRGLISKFRYDTLVTRETKGLIAKATTK